MRRYSSHCLLFGLPAGMFVITSMLFASVIHAQPPHADNHHEHAGSEQQDPQTAVEEYQAANVRMHEGMSLSFTGDPDVDFARGMIPHHEGAIAMANIVLEYGEDEQMRQLAQEIIDAQKSEIAFLKAWLERRDTTF